MPPQRWLHLITRPVNVKGFLGGSDGKEFSCNAGDLGLISGFGKCKYVTLHGKRDFTDMIKVSKSEMGRFSSV